MLAYSLPDLDQDRLLSTEAAAQQVSVAEHVIRTWRTRGYLDATGARVKLPIAGRDRRGRPLHRLGDVLDAERVTRRSGRSFRRCPPPDPDGCAPAPDWADLDIKAA